jgi:ribonuclease BN (tRNA processing enzyme)
MKIDTKVKFHPVGFGLFSSGSIGNFKYVYDCGQLKSNRRVNKCITNEFDHKTQLDLIVISHLHQDHINGIKKLLETIKSVDTIVLPYISPIERLLLLISYWETNGKNPSKWYWDLIVDPINTLSKGNLGDKVNSLVFIYGNSDKLSEFDNNPDFDKFKIDELNLDLNDLDDIHNSDLSDLKQIENEDFGNKVKFKYDGRLFLRSDKKPIWQFILFYPKTTDKIEKYFDKIQQLSKIKKNDKISKQSIISILKDINLSQLNKKVKVSGSDINNTSLMLYHSNLFRNYKFISHNSIRIKKVEVDYSLYIGKIIYPFNRKILKLSSSPNGIFYTGDVNLKMKYNEIKSFFGFWLYKTLLLQVPHHGSKNNWSSQITKDNDIILHLISSELANKKKLHPNKDVLYDIIKSGGHLIWCNEKSSLLIKEYNIIENY